MVDLLRHQAAERPDARAFTFLRDGERDEVSWTFAELDERARAIAAVLEARGLGHHDRVLLLYPQGLEYVAALFGCMYAGVLAIPLQPPGKHRAKLAVPKLQAIVADGGVALAATESHLIGEMRSVVQGVAALEGIPWLATDELDPATADDWRDLELETDELAYLQYTSGSTSTPKGVMVSHRNLLYNLHDFDDGYGHDASSVMVSWLPTFHDLGLVYGVFMPVYRGFHSVLLGPLEFLRRPIRWLEAIHHHRGTHSPVPNFAFDLAVSKSTPEEREALDLSCWKVALNGAEPIRYETEARFVEAFAGSGVGWHTISHAYGMSETTAVITKEHLGTQPVFLHLDSGALERHRVVRVPEGSAGARIVAGCGITTNETRVLIVEPDELGTCPEGVVGEIWVGGPTRAQGYWSRPEESEEAFEARTSDTGDGPYLRTGDLGFLADGQVFVTGRLKDMIIIRGENHYPQDLEWSVQYASDAIRPSCAAAFTRFAEGRDGRLVIVSEVYPKLLTDPGATFSAIREAISDHGLQTHEIVLIAPRTIFKTSSGKIMRRRTRQALEDEQLEVVARWVAPTIDEANLPDNDVSADGLVDRLAVAPEATRMDLLVEHVLRRSAAMLGLPVDALEPDVPVREMGFDSVQAVELADQLSQDLGQELPTTVLFDHPTADELASWLLTQLTFEGGGAGEADGDELEALLAGELDDL